MALRQDTTSGEYESQSDPYSKRTLKRNLMNKIRATIVFYFLMAIGSASIFFSSCKEKSTDGMLIITQTSGKENLLTRGSPDSLKYIPHTQIVMFDPARPDGTRKILTTDFYSARSPKISYDGKSLLFSACQKQNDQWQIWEMNLWNFKTRQITSSKENCTDPDYLPGDRIVFSILASNDTLKARHSLFVCNLDGSILKRITFNPATYLSSSILSDGRILTLSSQTFPDRQDPFFAVMRPDGTKADLFYKSNKESLIMSPGIETGTGNIVFIESDKSGGGNGKLITIRYNRPLHSKTILSSGTGGDFHYVSPTHSGKLLVSYRKSETDNYALYEFDPESNTLGKTIFNSPESDVLEVVEAGQHLKPKKLPSEVDMGVKTGLLLCQDINVSEMQYSGMKASFAKASRVEILGIDSTLGIVDVAEDGSFYLKVIADKPFRLQIKDKNGKVLNRPGGWIWLRPNERRGCVGCHQDPEIVPMNKVPLAVKNLPVSIPMHINKVVEKKVSLE
jgi:hypothetical protein